MVRYFVLMISFVIYGISYLYAYDRVVVFGDSLSDPGLLKKWTFHVAPSGLYWKRGFHEAYWKGRFSNGPIWTEYMDDFTGKNIKNYSYGGASTSSHLSYFTKTKLHKLRRVSRDLFTGDTDSLVKRYIRKRKISKEDVFIIWSGSNNFLNMQTYQRPVITSFASHVRQNLWDDDEMRDNLELIHRFVDISSGDIEKMASRLVKAGAKRILIPTIFMTPLLPLLYKPDFQDDREAFLYSTTLYNEKLRSIPLRYPEVEIVDMDTVLAPIVKDPSSFGFSKPIEDACFRGDWLVSSLRPCPKAESQSYFFYDLFHPSSLGHCWISYFFMQKLAKEGETLPSRKDYLSYCQKSFKKLRR